MHIFLNEKQASCQHWYRAITHIVHDVNWMLCGSQFIFHAAARSIQVYTQERESGPLLLAHSLININYKLHLSTYLCSVRAVQKVWKILATRFLSWASNAEFKWSIFDDWEQVRCCTVIILMEMGPAVSRHATQPIYYIYTRQEHSGSAIISVFPWIDAALWILYVLVVWFRSCGPLCLLVEIYARTLHVTHTMVLPHAWRTFVYEMVYNKFYVLGLFHHQISPGACEVICQMYTQYNQKPAAVGWNEILLALIKRNQHVFSGPSLLCWVWMYNLPFWTALIPREALWVSIVGRAFSNLPNKLFSERVGDKK